MVEDELRDTLQRRADVVEPSFDAWPSITRRIDRRQRRTRTATMSLVAGFSLAAVAVAVAMVTLAVPDAGDQNVAATGGPPRLTGTTTSLPFSSASPSTVGPIEAIPGQVGSGGPGGSVVPQGPAPTTAGSGSGPTETGMLSSGFHSGTIYPETAAELETIQAQVDDGHQPWWTDPVMVAASYLGNRGLTIDDDGLPAWVGNAGAMRYTAGGVGGWVSLAQLINGGSIHYVTGSRTDRVVKLRLIREGSRVTVEVIATESGKVVVRSKRPGADWNPSTTEAVVAGRLHSLTVQGAESTDLIVQVRHEGDDGRVGLTEELLGAVQPELEYVGLHDASVLAPGQLGPIGLDFTFAEVQRYSGIATVIDQGESCASVSPAGRPAGVAFVSTDGDDRVDVITVAAPSVRTAAGIGVGSTLAEVRQAHPGIEERLTDGEGRLVHSPDDPMQEGFEMIFGIQDGKVSVIWSGHEGLSDTDEICA